MPKVQLLPDVVASQVAAGEVVERPASILKELMENSLDAGAGRIDVEFSGGGAAFLRVADDGEGMDRSDALLSIERHATSKIRTGKDLARIETFGFRGEALPSIASVSRFLLKTRPHGVDAGTEIRLDGGKLLDVRDCGDSPGTQIEVRSLFFNVPARKKFLRTELTESAHVLQVFQTNAIAHPEVAMSLIKDSRLVHQLAATKDLRVRARDLLGNEFLDQLLPPARVPHEGIFVFGMLGRPGGCRADRGAQFFFLNRRPIQDPALSRALRETGIDAFGANRPGSRIPAILFLEMDPSGFDCNVHPSKKEVRFHRPDLVRDAVAAFLRHCLSVERQTQAAQAKPNPAPPPAQLPPEEKPESTTGLDQPSPAPPEARPEPPPVSNRLTPASAPDPSHPELTEFRPEPTEQETQPPTASTSAAATLPPPDFQFRGPLGSFYYLLESGEGLVLLHLPAAMERIYYEELSRGGRARPHPSQRLLTPMTSRLDAREFAWVVENAPLLLQLGFEIDPFGENTVKIDGVPAGFPADHPGDLLQHLLEECRTGGGRSAQRFLQDRMALSMAVFRARGTSNANTDARTAIARLFQCELPYASPTGKPTLLQFSWSELDRKFQ